DRRLVRSDSLTKTYSGKRRTRSSTPERAPHINVVPTAFPGDPMPGHSALVRFAVLVSLSLPGSAFAQFPPPAGSAGAGNSAISGIPYGPANPSVVGDPSGIGNASRIPPPGTNTMV